MKYWILLLLIIPLVSAVNINFDCPNKNFASEEFECSLNVFNGSGVYDVKVDLDKGDSDLKIWNDNKWKSTYYYLNEFIKNGDEEKIKLKISGEGNYGGFLKLRQDGKVESFDIEVKVRGEGNADKETRESSKLEVDNASNSEEIEVSPKKEKEVISLNSVKTNKTKMELIYVSKNAKIVDYLAYPFVLFLILIIGLLLWNNTI